MKKLSCALLLTLCLALLCSHTARSENPFFFTKLGVEDGLSQLSVVSMFQDADGYLWFGTRNGANRYNGYEFKIYQNEVNDHTTISDNYIRSFAQDKKKNIWISTSNGINCIDYTDKQITRFYPQQIDPKATTNVVQTLFKHRDGTIYAFNSRKVFICKADQTVESFPLSIQIASPLYAVTQGSDGDIYIGTENAELYIFSSRWKLKQYLPFRRTLTDNPPHSPLTTLLADNKGKLWIGTDEEGIYLFDIQKQTFTHHIHTGNSELNSNNIRKLIQYNDTTLLIGTFGGLHKIQTSSFHLKALNNSPTDQGGLSHFSIHSMLIDKDQTLWIGTFYGVNRHSPYYKPLTYIATKQYTGIIGKGQEDKDGRMWFATEGAGLFRYNPQSGEQKFYPLQSKQRENYETNILKALLIHGDSILCTTHFGSVYLFSIKKETYKKLYDYKYNDIYSLYIDRKQRLWIPTNSSSQLVLIENGREVSSFEANGTKRSFKGVTKIVEVKTDLFLMGTLSDSIYLYDKQRQTVSNLALQLQQNNQVEKLGIIIGLEQDKDNNLWIATSKNGLYRLNNKFKFIKHYQKEDGIAKSQISSLTLDAQQNVWITTGSQLYKLDRTNDTFSEIQRDDVPKLEFSEYYGNNLSSDGTIYFPGDKGLLAFNPGKKLLNPNIPPLYITSLVVNNKMDLSSRIVNQPITLEANQNTIALAYTAVTFIHTEKSQYAFKLDGADPTWHEVGNRREAYYNNLSPGAYTFRVRASNNDGIWNPKETTLQIIIKPPFYQTIGAYLFYISFCLLFVWRIMQHQQKKHERIREARFKQMEQQKRNELHEERMRMFTNFSHELRTPLTLIINPLNDLMQQVSFSPEVKESLQLIKRNTGRMLLLVNNLMDIQKYEAGKTILQKKRCDFSGFTQEMFHSFESVANNRSIHFILDNELPAPYFALLDEAEMEKVFFNLLSNAFKFTPSNGQVNIKVRTIPQNECELLPSFPQQHNSILIEPTYLFVEVSDSGKGICMKDAEKIFEPFYCLQEDVHKQLAGTGIGLNLTRSILLQHNGCIWVDCREDTGTRFMFLLPDTESQKENQEEKGELVPTIKSEINKKVNLLIEESEARYKHTILLVDDNREVLNYLEEQLSIDYLIIKAFNGKEALDKLEKADPHLVISDIMMPEINGIELCKRIKENQNYCHIPVILLTAKSMVTQIEEGLDVGADDYIVKPFQVSLLKARVRNILALREKMKTMYGAVSSLKELGIEEPKEESDFLKQYIDIVKANIANTELDVSVIYEALGLSRTSFYRKVKNVTGLSPIELIKNIRLEAGAKLLKESDLNVSEIAQQIGFSSRSYFAKSFKAVYGISPTEYQEKVSH